MPNATITDIIMILAVFLGPIVAVRITRYIDDRKEKRERQLNIFRVLMATRAATLSPGHIEALNLIDVEFETRVKKNKKILSAWRAYLNHVGDRNFPQETWYSRRTELLIKILHEMSIVLNYDFDETQIKTSVYSPEAHGEMEDDQTAIRRGLRNVVEGKTVIPMYVVNLPDTQQGRNTENDVQQANKQIDN